MAGHQYYVNVHVADVNETGDEDDIIFGGFFSRNAADAAKEKIERYVQRKLHTVPTDDQPLVLVSVRTLWHTDRRELDAQLGDYLNAWVFLTVQPVDAFPAEEE